MKKSLSLIIALALLPSFFFAAGKKKQEVIRVAMEGTWKPFGFVNEQGELAGFDVDVIKAISERIKDDNIKIQIEKTGWDGIFLALETGRIDVIANEIKKNPAREQRYLYADKPYNYDYPVIIFKKERNDINTAEDLFGKKVIVGTGSSFADWLEAFNKKTGNKVTTIYTGNDTTLQTIFADIVSGRADAAIDSPIGAEALISEQGYPLRYVKSDPDFLNPAFWVFRRNKKGEYLKEIFGEALEEIRADGTLSKLAIKWFGTDTTVKSK
ncbi:ABC-type amino acid transport/signal transduction system, periplasmic component [Treponema sp. JC4]|uniref:transporter substrate-binding domain-containing protein n=1 Tax=Treponema sp. JC4 TaxID=1124982 RepID=UPI00025AFB95|nr:transporter substrate-binding domain-containing protein [Treponema sp. JC4]EID85834.1 ABC-type amino acid transport/signal transduction system, periplasmic component [Treponema sp. JC4]